MTVEDADEFVPFQDVRIINATGSSLRCGIGEKRVWLPRIHVCGKLWSAGDRGKLYVRRWVALDRGLIDSVAAVAADERAFGRKSPDDLLHAVPRTSPHRSGLGDHPPEASAPRGELSSTSRPDRGPRPEYGPSHALATSLVERRRLRTLRDAAAPADGPECRA